VIAAGASIAAGVAVETPAVAAAPFPDDSELPEVDDEDGSGTSFDVPAGGIAWPHPPAVNPTIKTQPAIMRIRFSS
jgi:hypothetical protein